MSKGKVLSVAAILAGLFVMGCGNPCNDLKCDNCDGPVLTDACLVAVGLDNSDTCQNMLDDVPSCQ